MTDHLRMKGKDALTIEEARRILMFLRVKEEAWDTVTRRVHDKIERCVRAAKSRRDTREHMRHLGAEAAKKAGVKIVPEGKR